jgi:Ser-tRNA(Ala) deacylase AlaX
MATNRTYFWVQRHAGHELDKYQSPSNEENVEKARRLWCIPNVHQNDPHQTYDICSCCKQHHMNLAAWKLMINTNISKYGILYLILS